MNDSQWSWWTKKKSKTVVFEIFFKRACAQCTHCVFHRTRIYTHDTTTGPGGPRSGVVSGVLENEMTAFCCTVHFWFFSPFNFILKFEFEFWIISISSFPFLCTSVLCCGFWLNFGIFAGNFVSLWSAICQFELNLWLVDILVLCTELSIREFFRSWELVWRLVELSVSWCVSIASKMSSFDPNTQCPNCEKDYRVTG